MTTEADTSEEFESTKHIKRVFGHLQGMYGMRFDKLPPTLNNFRIAALLHEAEEQKRVMQKYQPTT